MIRGTEGQAWIFLSHLMAAGVQTFCFFLTISAELVENTPFPCKMWVSITRPPPSPGLAQCTGKWMKRDFVGEGLREPGWTDGQRPERGILLDRGWTQDQGGGPGAPGSPLRVAGAWGGGDPGGPTPLQTDNPHPAQTARPGANEQHCY